MIQHVSILSNLNGKGNEKADKSKDCHQ